MIASRSRLFQALHQAVAFCRASSKAIIGPPYLRAPRGFTIRRGARLVRLRERRRRSIGPDIVTLATQGGRDTASTNCIPATPIDAFIGDQRGPMRESQDA